MKSLEYLNYALKAVLAAAVAFTTGMVTATQDNVVSTNEWWVVIGGTLGALAIVFGVRNGPKPQ